MSYHRGEPYVWEDGVDMHIWSNLRDGEGGYATCARVDLRIFDEVVIKRFAHLIEEGRVPPAILRAVRKMRGRYLNEMLIAARKTAQPGGTGK